MAPADFDAPRSDPPDAPTVTPGMRRGFLVLVGILMALICAWALATTQWLLGGTMGGLLVGLGFIAWADDRDRRDLPATSIWTCGAVILALVGLAFLASFVWRGIHILAP